MDDHMQTRAPVSLSDATLHHLPEAIARPHYDREALSPGIVHIGLGNFHRAHQAWYLHRLMQDGLAQDWAILGAGVRASDEAMRARLAGQDHLTTLIELAPGRRSAEVTGAMIGFLPVEEDNAALIAAMADPAIRIVSLTVTEGGYFLGPEGGLDTAHPEIQHDAASPATPHTAFGAIVAALRLRREAEAGPFTVLSCDNLQGNGAITRRAVLELARLSDPDLADWIADHASFPNSMVDCIVPATGPTEIALALDMGIEDAAPVTHENFRQWVIEDNFCAGRPAWERVGATLTQDVHGYEAMKIRLLNAGHQVIANAGELLSVDTISGCMAHPSISALFAKVAREEIAPHVAAVPEKTPEAYLDLITERFSNTAIHDTTRRVAFDGSSRHPGFVLPTLREALDAGTPIEGLALVEALWARMCAGRREDGSMIAPNDPIWDRLHATALIAQKRPRAWLEMDDIYGTLADAPRFADAFEAAVLGIWRNGTEAAINAYVAR